MKDLIRFPATKTLICKRCGEPFEMSRPFRKTRTLCSLKCIAPVLYRLAAKSIVSETGCWLWQGFLQNHGHAKIFVGSRRMEWIHRVSWEIFKGPIPDDLCVLHNCIGTGMCWNPHHLRLGTQFDNNQDRVKQGREGNRKGEINGRAVLTEEQVRFIRSNYSRNSRDGLNQNTLAKMFGVDQGTISGVILGKTWTHL